jgi:phosphatidylserine/phosphatidylglycerophosphate/cardiolipin synthase-like enzyme
VLLSFSLIIDAEIPDTAVMAAREQVTIDRSFEGAMFFNDYQSTYTDVIIQAILDAQKTIDVAIYSLEDKSIIDALNQQQEKGIEVRIIVPSSKSEQHETLLAGFKQVKKIGRPIDTDDTDPSTMSPPLMHHKFIITDYQEDTAQLLFSSSNFTKIQQQYDPGFLLTTRDPLVIEHFYHEFSLLYEGMYGPAKIRSGRFKPRSLEAEYQNGSLDIWFGPGYQSYSLKEQILTYIDSAEKRIDILGWRINDKDIIQALTRKAYEGIDVRILADDYYLWDPESSIPLPISNSSITVVSDSYKNILLRESGMLDGDMPEEFNSFLHHHTIIIDESMLVTGTNNWTQRGFFYNDESVIATDINDLVIAYQQEFNRLYETLVGEPITVSQTDTHTYVENVSDQTDEILFYREQNNPAFYNSSVRVFARSESGELLGSGYLGDTTGTTVMVR